MRSEIQKITAEYLQPLCKATEKLFSPIRLNENDRMRISLDRDGTRFRVYIYAINPDEPEKEGYSSYGACGSWISRVPERTRIDWNTYTFAATDTTALIIATLWPENQLIFEPDAKIQFDYLLLNFVKQTKNAELHAKFKRDKKCDVFPYIENHENPLSKYQKVGLKGSLGTEGYALFMEQGTGKTAITIARICNEARKKKGFYKVLVVAPKNVRTNWRCELKKFATTPGKVAILRGNALDRMKTLIEGVAVEKDQEWCVIVCSYETLDRSWDALRMIEWDLTIMDESHYFKSTATKRYKNAMKLRTLSKQRMCLTGTPITNTLLDLFSQLEFLGEGYSGFHSFKMFRKYYMKFIKSESGRDLFTGYQNLPMIQERLLRCAFMVTKKEALPDLPDKVYDVCEVYMTPEQTEIYNKVVNQLAVEIKNELDAAENKSLVINNILTKLLRLNQITSGFITWDAQYDDEGNVIKPKQIDRIDPNPKLEGLVELLKDNEIRDDKGKTLIWATWVQDIKSISARLSIEGIGHVTFYGATSDADREIAVRRFNEDDSCKVFVGNPAAGGTGINLLGHNENNQNCYCNHVIYYSQNWSMVARAQSEDRAHRRGTKNHVRYTDLCVPGTIDEEIRARVLDKRISAYAIADLTNIIQKLLNKTVVYRED